MALSLAMAGAAHRRALFFLLAAACLPAAWAGEPTKPAATRQPFAKVSPFWRDYMIKAKTAQAIADPLERCLAFPDLPGNEWPAGHAAAHCRNHYAPFIKFEEVGDYVRRKDIKTLESRLSALLQQHFSAADHSEAIHYIFDNFVTTTVDADQISRQWLELAPESAYANMARGRYLRSLAWKSRGGKYAADTPREDLEQMSEYFAQAVPLLRKAIEIEPKMMPAYVSLADIGMADSMAQLEKSAFEAGYEQDPACVDLLNKQLQSLQPRWGGSYTEMEAAIERAKPFVANRPLVAVRFADPTNDMGSRFLDQELYGQAATVFELGAKQASDETALRQTAQVALIRKDDQRDQWKALAYLVQAERFGQGDAWEERVLGSLLVKAGEPLWATGPLKHSMELQPGSGYAQYYLAAAYYNSAQREMADTQYRAAMADPEFSLISAQEGAEMWIYARNGERAKPFTDALAAGHEDDAYGRYLRMMQATLVSKRYDEPALRRFVKETDPGKDRRLPEALAHVNRLLAEMDRIRGGMSPAASTAKKK